MESGSLSKLDLDFIKRVRKMNHQKGGSFVLSSKNKIYHGVPYEALNWIHGEQIAIGSMLTEETPESKFKLILIISHSGRRTIPCGMCRAAIFRYGVKNVTILCSDKSLKKIERFTISGLYPNPYIEVE